MPIRLRPHHVLCSVAFEGKGYDAPFTANMSRIVFGHLRAPGGRDETIRITDHADAFCAPCPRRRGGGCEADDMITALDARHAAALGLSTGMQLTWGDCLDRVVESVFPDDLDTLCRDCSWLAEGRCKTAVATLIATKKGRPEATPG